MCLDLCVYWMFWGSNAFYWRVL